MERKQGNDPEGGGFQQGRKKQGYFTSSANVLNHTEGEGADAGETVRT